MGNICRSPIAEGILRHKLHTSGIKNILVDSAGTYSGHKGEHPDARAIANARSHDIDISRLVARPFHKKDLDEFDHIFVMDATNFREVTSHAEKEEQRAKVEFLLNIKWPGKNIAVPDPYYGGEDGFEKVFQLVSQACDVLVENFKNEK